MEKKSIYKVIFEDETEYQGGTFEHPGWSKTPNKKIKALELILPNDDDIIRLENYEKYNFFVGARKPLNSKEIVLGHMYGLGCTGGVVTSYRITLISLINGDKYKIGDITVRRFPLGKEGMRRTATSGWKAGIIN